MATADNREITQRKKLNERVFTDENLQEQVENNNPLNGIENENFLPLEEIGKQLTSIFGDEFLIHVNDALSTSQNPMDRLTPDESAAIRLYTMETSLYRRLNDALRDGNLDRIKCFFPYLKLFYTALFKLPWSTTNHTLWRGVRQDLNRQLIPNTRITWWQISSCTKLAEVAGKFGDFSSDRSKESCPRSVLIIETIWAKDITNHSVYQTEQELIILSGTSLVVGSVIQDGDTTIFHLYDCPTPEQLLIPLFSKANRPFLPEGPWSEGRLETFLQAKRNTNERLFLENLSMNEANVCILANKFEFEQPQWSELSLWRNALDSRCAPHLAAILKTNYLTYINLGSNRLGDDGAICLLALQYCHKLQEVILWDNQISDIGLGYLITVIDDTAIKLLNIGTNQITDDGCKRLLAALPDTTEEVDFFSNHITKENLEIIKNAFRDVKNLRRFNVGGMNPIALDPECRQILEDEGKMCDCVLAW